MGLCASNVQGMTASEIESNKREKEKSKQIEEGVKKDQAADQQVSKLLLLGAGESGKSTLFKQMISIYGKGFSVEERKTFLHIIYGNIITAMKVLCKQSRTLASVSSSNAAIRDYIEIELKSEEELGLPLAQKISQLWADEGIQKTHSLRAKFQLFDCAKYFLDKAKEIAQPGYIPNEQDVFRCRVRTTGIVENSFEIQGNKMKMFDVGGQRNERKKWIHCFEDVTAVLFVAAISEYDQMLFEDENVNRVTEALTLFDEICNSRWFHETPMILFLNKRDLFADKIKKGPIDHMLSPL